MAWRLFNKWAGQNLEGFAGKGQVSCRDANAPSQMEFHRPKPQFF